MFIKSNVSKDQYDRTLKTSHGRDNLPVKFFYAIKAKKLLFFPPQTS